MGMQRRGVEEVAKALDTEEVTLILVQRDIDDTEVLALVDIARNSGIPVHEGPASDLWRMAKPGDEAPLILALVGRKTEASLAEVLHGDGVVWMLVGVKYAVNIGYVVRTAEITGASALIVCGDFSKTEQRTALRASMQSDRFIPVFWNSLEDAMSEISDSGRRLVSVEDVGDIAPWQADLTGNPVICVGGEHDGIPDSVIEASQQVIRLPMVGFVPSYNLQTAMGVVAMEALKQNHL